ncbi:hypothetical protein GURASL_10430 [Geotalea uraniireducens]|uniref:DUF5668 domain-containing protein n=1 Tax=Geotalea uraniireducens TaxID=351604 RepID=A0ABN6VVK4_9BACT|nr:hypothetical protein [Geotalea uraniireducens]BDV42120.1 hypothetical protein GURASL_10430 [Geotalea uraniireducens]
MVTIFGGGMALLLLGLVRITVPLASVDCFDILWPAAVAVYGLVYLERLRAGLRYRKLRLRVSGEV